MWPSGFRPFTTNPKQDLSKNTIVIPFDIKDMDIHNFKLPMINAITAQVLNQLIDNCPASEVNKLDDIKRAYMALTWSIENSSYSDNTDISWLEIISRTQSSMKTKERFDDFIEKILSQFWVDNIEVNLVYVMPGLDFDKNSDLVYAIDKMFSSDRIKVKY